MSGSLNMLLALDVQTMESAGPSLIGILAQHGLPGVIIGLLVLWVYMKDKELKTERDARIADAKQFTDLALKLQENAISSVNKLTDVFEEIRRIRDAENSRPTRRDLPR